MPTPSLGNPPLTGIKVLEFAGLAPGPFAGMFLADAGASVLRIDRPTSPSAPLASTTAIPPDLLTRHKSSLIVDLKSPAGVDLVRAAVRAGVDVLIDPYRPGVLDARGLGPEVLCAENPRLVYARLTGFRRPVGAEEKDGVDAEEDNKWARSAGHDINFMAVSGVLATLGWGSVGRGEDENIADGSIDSSITGNSSNGTTSHRAPRPVPPGNLLADFAGGGSMLVTAVVMALWNRDRPGGSGNGQVVDVAMVDGVSYLASMTRMLQWWGKKVGAEKTEKRRLGEVKIRKVEQEQQEDVVRGDSVGSDTLTVQEQKVVGGVPTSLGNGLLDGGCPWYDTYATSDGKWVAVGALEERFYVELVTKLGLFPSSSAASAAAHSRWDIRTWPRLRLTFAAIFARHPLAHWEAVFAGSDACCTPVLDYDNIARRGQSTALRPPFTMHASPLLGVGRRPRGRQELDIDSLGGDKSGAERIPVRFGSGAGVPGDGFTGEPLPIGQGGEERLEEWFGWQRGHDFVVGDNGACELLTTGKCKL